MLSSRDGDDALASKRLDLLGLPLILLVAVAQPAKESTAPAPDSSAAPAPDAAAGGEGEAVVAST